MSESVAKPQRTTSGSLSSSPVQPWSVEREADRLMDDLFSDLDGLLEGANKLPTEPAKPDYVSLKPVAIPSLNLTPSPVLDPEETLSPPTPAVVPAKPAPTPPQKVKGRYLDKILFGVAFASFLAVLGWLVADGKIEIQRFLPQSSTSRTLTQNPALSGSEADAEFLNYMLRSLELIENQPQTGQALPPAPGTLDPVTGTATNPQVQWVPYPVYIPYNPGGSAANSLLPPPPATNPSPASQPQAQAQPQPTETPSGAAASPASPPPTPKPET
ncbi:MAG: hypothetical protein SAJ12_09910, partial [Jaaginema sp. PMC 1079.18]|nr:hypothetical protein [Jaaginema sp. PMC 1079.18]